MTKTEYLLLMSRSTLLVRHAQASFGAHDYDQLSPLGEHQAHHLGLHLASTHTLLEAIYLGDLKRHLQTFDGIRKAYRDAPEPLFTSVLNEYDPEALLNSMGFVAKDGDGKEQHFKQLRLALRAWMAGDVTPSTMPSYAEFREGLLALLSRIRIQHKGNVLIVTSGGPIATLVGSLLEASVEATISINFRVRNASVTELTHDDKRHHVVGLNHIGHFERLDDPKWITYV